MELCSQCQNRPAITNLSGHLLCLECYSTLLRAEAAAQQANNERLSALRSMQNYFTEMMSWNMGFRATPPQFQIPQPIHTHINNPTFNNMNISNSQIGLLNTGSIQDVKNIDIRVSTLAQAGHQEIAEALAKLTEAIVANEEVNNEQKTELLDQLNEISNQALIPIEQRKTGIVRPLLTGLATGINSIGTLAKLWSMFGNTVCEYFGIENPIKENL